MNKNYSTFDILNFPDEILLSILNKLSSTDVLYSLIGVNKRFDRLARESSYTKSIDLVNILYNKSKYSRKKSVLDRFCFDILPRIQFHIQHFTLDSLSINRVLSIGYYPELCQLVLVNVQLDIFSNLFNKRSSSFVQKYKYQISHLVITINDDLASSQIELISINSFVSILKSFTNLKHLQLNFDEIHAHSTGIFISSPLSFIDLPSTACYSLNLSHLNVRLYSFDDCLHLLDGRLNQLQTFIVKIDRVDSWRSMPLDKKVISNLKNFSLIILEPTDQYDNKLVVLLREMYQLRNLILSLTVRNQMSFIDGTQLNNDFLMKMAHLQSFSFDIISETIEINNDIPLSCVVLQRTFIERGYNVNCYLDYPKVKKNRCHVYSFPFILEYMQSINNNFPGGQFHNVRILSVRDSYRPFEHDFFLRISRYFPMLQSLQITNKFRQRNHSTRLIDGYEETLSIINFPHLVTLRFLIAQMDYLRQFLHNSKTHLPCLEQLYVGYSMLATVTENFTSNATRTNCAKVKHLDFYSTSTKYSKNFYSYFPLLFK